MTPSDEIRRAVKAIYRPGDIIEIRSFGPNGRRVGRYPLGWDIVRAAEKEDTLGQDVYFVLNPTSRPPIPISPGTGTSETDVPHWRYFLLDFDPIRPIKTMATDEQYQAALLQARMARDFMENLWGTTFITANSGNGVHLLVHVDMPTTPAAKEAVRRAQRVIADRFTTSDVKVDCFPDAGRLVRAYGTLNKKEIDAQNKWRRSAIL